MRSRRHGADGFSGTVIKFLVVYKAGVESSRAGVYMTPISGCSTWALSGISSAHYAGADGPAKRCRALPSPSEAGSTTVC